MKRRTLIGSALTAAVLPRRLAAQRAGKIPRIGFVTAQAAAGFAPFVEPFRAGLGEFGYAEGRNLGVEFRYGDDRIDRVPELVAELVRQPVDLLVVQGQRYPLSPSSICRSLSFTRSAATQSRRGLPRAWRGRAAI